MKVNAMKELHRIKHIVLLRTFAFSLVVRIERIYIDPVPRTECTGLLAADLGQDRAVQYNPLKSARLAAHKEPIET